MVAETREDAASGTLSDRNNSMAGIPHQLQLDIVWEFKDDIDLLSQACAVAEEIFLQQI